MLLCLRCCKAIHTLYVYNPMNPISLHIALQAATRTSRLQLEGVKHEKETLKVEKQQLRSRVTALNESVARLSREKVELERSLELEEEAFINSLFRQLAHVMHNYKAMDEVRAPCAACCPSLCLSYGLQPCKCESSGGVVLLWAVQLSCLFPCCCWRSGEACQDQAAIVGFSCATHATCRQCKSTASK